MAVKSDGWIRKMANEKGLIEPFADRQVRENVVSYGLSSYGYDFRVADEFRIIRSTETGCLDPKKGNQEVFEEVRGSVCEVPPNAIALARSVEYFRIPRDILTICFGKSTYARCGLVVNVTPFEPEWEGFVTLQMANTAPVPIRVYAFEGIAQVLFLQSDAVCEVSYADKKGKYQKQTQLTHAKV